ncbi:MAG: hypothetical protein ACTHOJ_09810 [Sphingomonas oligoaromativorans]
MANYVQVANLAASKIGEDDQLVTPDDDTHLGRSVAAVWDEVRQAALRDHPYNFARKRANLPAQALVAPPIGWKYSFRLPTDCLRLIDLLTRHDREHYAIEGGCILWSNPGPLPILYIADIVEVALWDSLFVEAFASRLAFQIADRITGDRGRKSDAWNAYLSALSQAKRVDARETPRIEEEPSGWELARTGWYAGSRIPNTPWGRGW